jgi:F0F1-type ATP synthase assembly protein I
MDRALAYFEASVPFWMAALTLLAFVAGFVAIAGGWV